MHHTSLYQQQSSRHFGLFRIIFGAYLAWHFASLLPYATELFSSQGIFNSAHPSPYFGKWPNPLFMLQWPGTATTMLSLGVLASLSLCVGHFRRLSSLYLWFLSSCLFTANPLIANPSLGYTGLLLLLCALTPRGEAYVLRKHTDPSWKMPKMIPICVWSLLALGYSFSGLVKIGSPSWVDGSALQHVLENPLARPNFLRDLLLALPDGFLQLLTWSTLALEILFAPLVLFKQTRPWAWLTMLSMHLGIMCVIDFADLSLGMMMVHLFTYDPRWLPAKHTAHKQSHTLFVDGDCSFCQRSVRIMMKLDPHKVVRFAPLQGVTAQSLPHAFKLTGDHASEAAVLLEQTKDEEKLWRGADAILRTLYLAGGLPSLLWPLHLLPESLKNRLYSYIAKHRHQLSSHCSLPTQDQRNRLLP